MIGIPTSIYNPVPHHLQPAFTGLNQLKMQHSVY